MNESNSFKRVLPHINLLSVSSTNSLPIGAKLRFPSPISISSSPISTPRTQEANNRSKLISELEKVIENHKLLKQETLFNCNKITSKSREIVSFIKQHLSQLKKMLSEAKSIFPNQNSSEFSVSIFNFRDFLMNTTDMIESTNIKLDLNSFEKLFETFQSHERTYYFPPDLEETLNFFKRDLNDLITYNIEKDEISFKSFKRKITQGNHSAVTKVNNGKLFIYGGFDKNIYLKSAFLLDTENLSFEELPAAQPRSCASALFMYPKIFVFGGFNGKSMKDANYFDLHKRTWHNLSDLPSPISNTTSVQIEEDLLIAGSVLFLEVYNTLKDSYTDLNSDIDIGPANTLIIYQDMVFVLAEKVYFASQKDLKTWNKTKVRVNFKKTTCRPLVKQHFCYFADEDCTVYRFDLTNYSLVTLARV